ncbi:glutaminyl-peptide cyclotransferase isoform X1 [Tribolium castaneum]|uniref:glutaminyl-peptide cyclotransferase isoform X1 n=1 Tax=Tribolium castaneum TaxID=7070 RepID=UPI00077DE5B8|nr:PREDICTED: glutaminyl-peptide cyclotransferase isoform X1 [Tribolium castaneum]|eukprot:XP_015838534.1 PREDICTED: glutaminyl-peptide cyclotransferase isoform X1 [Tribolium castaneum]
MSQILLKLFLFTGILTTGYCNYLKQARDQHRLQLSSKSDLRYLSSLSDPNYINKVLDKILIPRVAGTPEHEKVFKFLTSELRRLGWQVDVDEFVERAPIFSQVTFKNIVASPNPQAERFLVLACHYDSKYFPNAVFVGAIDSAVPCAMMLEIAKTLSKELGRIKDSPVGLKFIFFDGEEAFEEWGPNDSIWGAKHLAQVLHANTSTANGEIVTELDKMDVLVLLDLIGMKNPKFLNFFENTQRWFVRLSQIEIELHRMNLLRNHKQGYFQSSRPYGRIEDDHLPFLRRDVPVLHLISTPFPPEWHTPRDNRNIVDMNTVNNLNLILKIFISEYLQLLSDPSNTATSDINSSNKEFCPRPNLVFYQPLLYYIFF